MAARKSWKMTCVRCNVQLISRRTSVSCPECGQECRSSTTREAPGPYKVRGDLRFARVYPAENVVRPGDPRTTIVFKRRVGGVEVTVHKTENALCLIGYSVRLTYSHRRRNAAKWEFSETLPAAKLPTAIKLLELAAHFIASQPARPNRMKTRDL